MHPLLLLLIGMAVVIGGILLLRLQPFVALLLGALVVAMLTTPDAILNYALNAGADLEAARALAATHPAERIAEGFGDIVGSIGIIIAMASIIGACLLESGAADRVVRGALRLLGEKRAGPAFLGSGFLLSIPVFFDTVFYLMIPLAKSLRTRTGKNYLLYVLAIVAGGTMAHSLVPPTPGPLFVAAELEVGLGVMIVGGCLVGLFAASAGYLFARWANARWDLPLREAPEALAKLEELASRPASELPPLWLSLLPIVVPVALIAGTAAAESAGWAPGVTAPGWERAAYGLLMVLGEKNLALILGAGIALAMLIASPHRERRASAVQGALSSAGVIILITGAGGAFGQILQQTGISGAIDELAGDAALGVLPLAFLLTTLVRTAQGSATVAMITAAAAFQGLSTAETLGFHPVYLALAIGCGSKPIMWMNDSGFWIISTMSGMTAEEGLRTLTPQLLVMGVAGLIAVIAGAWVLPLV